MKPNAMDAVERDSLSGGVRVPCCPADVKASWLRAVSGLGR